MSASPTSARDRYRASDKGRATSAAHEAKPAVKARHAAWSRTPRGQASRWLAKHRQRYADVPYSLDDIHAWMLIRPARCPYTGHDKLALHMNAHTLEVEGWVSANVNWTALPWMRDSLRLFCELNDFPPPERPC